MRIKELREERGLSQAEVAKAVFGSQSNLAKWEKGTVQPSADFLLKLADFFNVSTDYLLGRTDELGAVIVPGGAGQLSADEQEILLLYAELSPSRKDDLKIYLRALSGSDVKFEKKKA